MVLWGFCAKNKPKTRHKHFLNSFPSSPFSLIFSLRIRHTPDQDVEFSKAPKLPQQPQGLSGGRNDSRWESTQQGAMDQQTHCTSPWRRSFLPSTQSQWFSLGFRHLNPLKLLKIISRRIRFEIKWGGVRCTPPLFRPAWQTPCLPAQGLVELQGRRMVL